MKRRGFLQALSLLSMALLPMRTWAARLPRYAPFRRAGCLITPRWRWVEKGERIYKLGHSIKDDGYLIARVSHWHLTTSLEETTLQDDGHSPKELGFLDTKWAKVQFSSDTWKSELFGDREPVIVWDRAWLTGRKS